ncbi:MAG TPA: tRNA (adenosine(37)-N6)-threonylcarbamoyltransferase complex ATPase subunit type 1 TsaE [Alphaproteobacteria bacterium]|nr:tRNA (adenosine(37)-N6)-threonylcarbamoyltransferase complex ATPase subunit type 1 TsaE [Alphaproteobacteria bacterium]
MMTQQPGATPVETRTIPLPDEAATAALAERLAALLQPGDAVALAGDLGGGKTSFARAAIRALARAEVEVPSPTFTLVQTYELGPAPVWHFDLYRLSGPDEVIELGWDEARAGGIVLVEWPERLGSLLPADRLDVALAYGGAPGTRVATLTGHGGWVGRLEAFG